MTRHTEDLEHPNESGDTVQRVLWHKLIRLLAVVALFTGLFNAMPPANAVVLFQAAGAASSSTGNATPAWPAHQVGDIGLLFIETGGSQSVSFISQPEWVQVTGSP